MTQPNTQPRLSTQGLINHHRKLVFVVMLIALA
ncbi:MAG: hypothetical protein RLZZ214_3742, partial [Verrucomicrobiota bacterium]